jgi:hypothetical protein
VPIKKAKLPLSKTNPKLAKEAFGWDPKTIYAGSSNIVDWKCPKGHIWQCTPSSRISQNVNCSICSGRQLLTGFNDFETLYPHLAKEAYGWDPKKENIWYRKVEWKCSKGHIYPSLISNRIRRDGGCPVCAGKKIIVGYNDLKSLYPDIAVEANGWDPEKVTAGSSKMQSWKCKLGHIWKTDPKHRTRRGDGCPTCSGLIVLRGFNDLQSLNKKIASEADGWDPSTVTLNSGKSMAWKCKLGHRWKVRVADRTYQTGSGCPTCSGQTTLAGFNDLVTTHPDIAKEAFGWDPSEFTAGSSVQKLWKCSLGHTWKSIINSRTLQKTKCLVCGNRQLLIGFNDLATVYPLLAKQAYKWNASKILVGSSVEKWWKCEFGHKWKTKIITRTFYKSGCPTCAPGGGFDPNDPGFLYLLEHPHWNMFQIGITNSPDDRLKDHRKLGWELLEIRGPMDGHLTPQWETAILRMLKAKGADLSNKEIAGKFDGYSEAWSKAIFPVKSIKELMRLTEEFEEGK